MDNILFAKDRKGILFGKNPTGKEVYFNIENEPSVFVFDGNENRLKQTIGCFTESILSQENFDVIAFGDHINSASNKREHIYNIKNFYATIANVAEEIDRRYNIFFESKVKNIIDYNKNGGDLQRIALMIDCDSTALIKRRGINMYLYEVLCKGRAAGVFTCLFSAKEFKNKNKGCFSYVLDLVPFVADYYEYENAFDMLENDEKFKQAIAIAKSKQIINSSQLQRQLKLGRAKAEQYIQTMQNLGIVGKEQFYMFKSESEKIAEVI